MISLQIPIATKAALEQRAEAGHRSVSGEIRLAISEHLSVAETKETT